jgi:hypothetical protein
MACDTSFHTIPRRELSLGSHDTHYCRKTLQKLSCLPNTCHTLGHMPSAYFPGLNLLIQSVHQSANGTLNCNLLQNLDTNCAPRSDIIDLCTPCSFRMLLTYNLANLSPPYVVRTGMKCVTFVRRPTITYTESLPLGVLGSPLTKSMLMSSHFHSGMGSGWSNPLDFLCSILTRWHMSHYAMNFATSPFIPFHQYLSLRSTYILVALGWMEYTELWASSMMVFLKWPCLGTHNLFLNHKVPYWSTLKSGDLFSPV